MSLYFILNCIIFAILTEKYSIKEDINQQEKIAPAYPGQNSYEKDDLKSTQVLMDDAFLGNNQQEFQLNQKINISTVQNNEQQLKNNNNNNIDGFQRGINPNANNNLNVTNGQYNNKGKNVKKKEENVPYKNDNIQGNKINKFVENLIYIMIDQKKKK